MQAQQAVREAEWTDYSAIGDEAPMAQFMASYRLGDDLFDDSFSIDSPAVSSWVNAVWASLKPSGSVIPSA
jgi:hypothetical protein